MSRVYDEWFPRGWKGNLAAFVLLSVAGAGAYANTFHSEFYFDGESLQNSLRVLSGPPLHWLRQPPRTIGYLTFDVQYTLHGLWLPGFHAVNLAIHVLAAFLIYGCVRQAINIGRFGEDVRHDAAGLAIVSALVFELHPLQTQSVSYLYQRFESLMGMFFIAAVFCFLRGAAGQKRSWRLAWYLMSWICVFLSTATKEVGVMAPLVIFWLDRAIVTKSWQELFRYRWWFYTPYLFVCAAAVIFLVSNFDRYANGGILTTHHVGVLEYARTQPAVILHYLRLFVWPQGQCLDYIWPPASLWYEIWPPLGGLFLISSVTVWAIFRKPWLGFLLGSVFVILAPTSSFLPIVDLAFEHRMYLPVACLGTAAVACCWRIWGRAVSQRAYGRGTFLLRFAPSLVWVALLGCTTYARNEVYRDGVTLWENVLLTQPRNARALNNLAWHVEKNLGDIPRAIALNRAAIRLKPDIASAHRALAALLFAIAPRESIYHGREAVRLEPKNWENSNNLGILLAGTEPKEADALFQNAIELAPFREEPYLNIAKLYDQQKRQRDLIGILESGLRNAKSRGFDWPNVRRHYQDAIKSTERGKTRPLTPHPAAETAAPLPPVAP